jgi:hypothetical protein
MTIQQLQNFGVKEIIIKSMKNLILTFAFLIVFIACDKDDNKPKTELEKLPPATQTGAQTFGCLIDGKAFIPAKFGSNAPRAFYQFVGGSYTLGISAGKGGGTELISVIIGALDILPISENTFALKSEQSGNFLAKYLIGGGFDLNVTTTDNNPGTIIITNFDPANFIISGTFEFSVIDNSGNEIKITQGRFDLNYTN